HYHGIPHRDFLIQLLQKFIPEVYLSCHPRRVPDDVETVIGDTFLDLGPYGGVLSAMRFDPNSAWLVVACDFPLMDEETITQLMAERDPSKTATCFHDPSTGFPEPLLTIWEPRAYPILLHNLSQGISCLRKSLINSDTKKLNIEKPEVLKNVNTPEEMEELKKKFLDARC
ncbi:MAG: NTP transferase domain-containing protein, partial [Saprospiraceae bacterium]